MVGRRLRSSLSAKLWLLLIRTKGFSFTFTALGRHCRDFEPNTFEQRNLDVVGSGRRHANHISLIREPRQQAILSLPVWCAVYGCFIMLYNVRTTKDECRRMSIDLSVLTFFRLCPVRSRQPLKSTKGVTLAPRAIRL